MMVHRVRSWEYSNVNRGTALRPVIMKPCADAEAAGAKFPSRRADGEERKGICAGFLPYVAWGSTLAESESTPVNISAIRRSWYFTR